MKNYFQTAPLALLMILWSFPNVYAQSANVVKDGATVSLEYTLSGEDGKVIESNKGKEPLRYVDGQSQIIPGLEKALEGMKPGAEKKVSVKPEDAYGKVDPNLFHEVPKENVPADSLQAGTVLYAKDTQGQVFPVRVHEVKDKTVVIDMNHPLAGKTLLFDVKILDVQPPQAK